MQTANDDHEHRLLPMSAGDYYSTRKRLADLADQLLEVSNGGPFSAEEAEQMWLDVIRCAVTLDDAWRVRRPNLKVVK